MPIIRKQKNPAFELAKAIVKEFFDCCDMLKPQFPDEMKELEYSRDIIKEVFRHSCCLALDLDSVLSFEPYSNISIICSNRIRRVVGDIIQRDIAYRQGILQATTHVLVASVDGKAAHNYEQ